MAKIIWRQMAIDDLDQIYDYIAETAPDRAENFISTLREKAWFLSENPRIGETRLPNYPAVRVFPCKNYLLLFRPLDTARGIEMIRIIHGARDYINKLFI
ncbi:MAG: type II toxin-antitoxin system RelE/ParE family toxin [Alphaproteobacteria bacterium]|nr:type II toxin-antitoxin system RelE/ParE family toxin [Alphaproteobacteria bacterium]